MHFPMEERLNEIMKGLAKNVSNSRLYMKEIITIGLPVTLQSIFQASYSFVDQLMVGTLGTVSIAGSGLGGKFSSLVTFTLNAVAAVASVLIAQYHGTKDEKGISKSFVTCSLIAGIVALVFAIPGFLCPQVIMGIYSNEQDVVLVAADYLRIIAVSYLPMTATLMLSSLFRSVEKSKYPMYVSVLAIFANVFFNWLLIFGKLGCPRLGIIGAAYGTLISRVLEALVLVLILCYQNFKSELKIRVMGLTDLSFYKKISVIVFPILLNEFSWSVGENIYAGIYGRLGKEALAAMTLTNPLQGLFIGMFSGLSSAAVVMVGKRLGQNKREEAFSISKYLIKVGFIGSLIIATIIVVLAPFYVKLYNVEPEVMKLTVYILCALAAVIFAKILNMILGGGIIRSGGNTTITLIIDAIGTWIFGVPLGLLTAFAFHLPIYWVYFILSLEEVVRLIIGFVVFYRKRWMQNVTK